MNFKERACAVPNCEERIMVPETYKGRSAKCLFHRTPVMVPRGHTTIPMRIIIGEETTRKLFKIFK